MCTHSHTHAAQSLHCRRNEGLGTFHAGHGERTSVTVLAWLSESNVVAPSAAPLRVCFSSVPPSVPFLFCDSPCGLVASHGKYCVPSHFYSGYGEEEQYSLKKLPGDIFCAVAYFITKEHVHYVCIWFVFGKLVLSPVWLERGMAAHPVSDQMLCPIIQE